MRISKHETNELIYKLEERKYGTRLNSMELAQRAGVPLDDVNRVERQLPIENERSVLRIAKALGVTPDALRKMAGQEEMSEEELRQLYLCAEQPMPEPCPGP